MAVDGLSRSVLPIFHHRDRPTLLKLEIRRLDDQLLLELEIRQLDDQRS
jgi:hypothetical protein